MMIQKSFMNSAERNFSCKRKNLQKQFYHFEDESKIGENSQKSEFDYSHAKQLRFKTNDELLVQLDIIEILTKESGSKIEDIQSSIITALTDEFDKYIETTLEGGEWGSETEIVAFSELYDVNIHVFDLMTSPTPYLIAENNTFTHTIYLLLTNNYHFDLLLIRGDSEKIDFKKI